MLTEVRLDGRLHVDWSHTSLGLTAHSKTAVVGGGAPKLATKGVGVTGVCRHPGAHSLLKLLLALADDLLMVRATSFDVVFTITRSHHLVVTQIGQHPALLLVDLW